ncbi:MAG: hypothetical protein QNK37_01355 [Acidobacteriota bacterium]|nr:hypothetical protein [Acidobacteriota bacterium]
MEVEIALKEEIGNPELFVGRQKEMDYFLNWMDKVKRQIGWSTAVLARRRKGKTALLQRLFNIVYTRNDPQLIPFYFRIPEVKNTLLDFSEIFYRALLSAYFGFKTRTVVYINQPLSLGQLAELAADDRIISEDIKTMKDYLNERRQSNCWQHASHAGHRIASLKDERIVQILDEFQFLDRFTYFNQSDSEPMILTGTYQYMGSSKISPQLIAGSYIGWLNRIIDKMVGRYKSYYLKNLSADEALTAVFNYARVYGQDVTDESAVWMAEACDRDPYTIACMFDSNFEPKDLTTPEGVSSVLDYETSVKTDGEIARMWYEYLATVIERTNDINAKRIVLYLAKYSNEDRNRKQIAEDLNLDLTDKDLDDLLRKLVAGDILRQGESRWAFRGLGDPIFDMVFRKAYEPEIEQVDIDIIRKSIAGELEALKRDLKSERGKMSNYRGETAEYRMRYKIAMAGQKRRHLNDLVHPPMKRDAPKVPDLHLAPFDTVAKHTFHDNGETIECDLYAQAAEGPDVVVEVKDWEDKVKKDRVSAFIQARGSLVGRLDDDTLFLFYSEQPIADANKVRLQEAGILYADRNSFPK